MGKAAENEKRKLRATFYNNLATGFVITGYAVPYFAFLRKAMEQPAPDSFSKAMLSLLSDEQVWLLSGLGLWVVFLAWLLRRMTNRIANEIED